MKLMPDIITESWDGGTVIFQLRVPSDLVHFSGHFPGLPILPGVVQLDWAARLVRLHLPDLKASYGIKNLKFHALVRPGAVLNLQMKYDADKRLLQFIYRDDERTYSSGQIQYKSDAP